MASFENMPPIDVNCNCDQTPYKPSILHIDTLDNNRIWIDGIPQDAKVVKKTSTGLIIKYGSNAGWNSEVKISIPREELDKIEL